MKAAGLVLAAGGGSRFGGPKALARWGDELFVERAVATLRTAGCSPAVVVLGARAPDIAQAPQLGDAVVLVNDAWVDGMGSSLCTGLAALAELGAPAVVVLLVAQPQVSPGLVRRLLDGWSERVPAVSASYPGRRRNPVL